MIQPKVAVALSLEGFFGSPGAYVLVDGQYGSTGKGLAADLLEQYDYHMGGTVDLVTTNAGPNSGHTAIINNDDGTTDKVFTQQLPVFSACRGRRVYLNPRQDIREPVTYINGGAIIDPEILDREIKEFGVNVYAHRAAAVINKEVMECFDGASLDTIASTGKGVGQAMAGKVMRRSNVIGNIANYFGINVASHVRNYADETVFVETAQGFSLGINSGFYPYTTSRECSVPQALADAGISPYVLNGVFMVVRAHPIRVGNTDKGDSGPCYPDQHEIQWEDIEIEPELTSVTKRVRRIFTFSDTQLRQACLVNRPNVVLLNFVNYLTFSEANELARRVERIIREYVDDAILLIGVGPAADDIYTVNELYKNMIPPHRFRR